MPEKKVVKKKQEAPKGAAALATGDARVAQQLRVMETIATKEQCNGSAKRSPRTEGFISRLLPVLDFFGKSEDDIAKLVKRCHYDETEIQIAVAGILDEKGDGEAWETKKTKQQMKDDKKREEEEKKQREQEEKLEKVKKERQAVKRREEEEQRARDEAAARAAALEREETERFEEVSRKKDKRKAKQGAAAAAAASSAPTQEAFQDPAILFLGQKPTQEKAPERSAKENWNSSQQWSEREWEEWRNRNNQDWNSNGPTSWNNRNGQDRFEKPAKGDGKGKRGKNSQKSDVDPVGIATEDLWDIPENPGAEAMSVGLDQWTLGDIRQEELKRESSHPAEETWKEVSAPLGLPPSQPQAPVLPPPVRPSADGEGGKGSKGAGKDRGKNREPRDRDDTKREREDRPERPKPRADSDGKDKETDQRKLAIEEKGEACEVRKHSSMGCAVVSMKDPRVRAAILEKAGPEVMLGGVKVQVKAHFDKETKQEILTDIFVAWGRQTEKATPVSEHELAKFFDAKAQEIMSGWRREADAVRKAQEEAQQREEAARRQREAEELRRYEEEMSKRQAEIAADEEKRQAAERAHLEELKRIQEQKMVEAAKHTQLGANLTSLQGREPTAQQAKWLADLQAKGPSGGNTWSPATAPTSNDAARAGMSSFPQSAQAQWSAAQAQQWMAHYAMQQAAQQGQQGQQGAAPAAHGAGWGAGAGAGSQQARQQQMQQWQQQMQQAAMQQGGYDQSQYQRQAAYYAAWMSEQQRAQQGAFQQAAAGQGAGYASGAAAQTPGGSYGYNQYGRGERI